jgi:hypothetical protein
MQVRGNLIEQRQCAFGFLDIEARDCKARVHDDKVADRDLIDQCD